MLRFGSVRWLSALLLVCLVGTVARAAEITGTAIRNDNVIFPPPPGKSDLAVKGSYTLDAGQTVDKIQAEFYAIDKDGKESLVGSNIVPDPIPAQNYITDTVRVDVPAKYKVKLYLYAKEKKDPVATNSFSIDVK